VKTLERLPPTEYRGQELCPRCGDDGAGHAYMICADNAGYSHDESCALYTYGNCCEKCESEMLAETQREHHD
jgi:hypothetical protein